LQIGAGYLCAWLICLLPMDNNIQTEYRIFQYKIDIMKVGMKIEIFDKSGNLLIMGKVVNVSLDQTQFIIKDKKGFTYSSLMYKDCIIELYD